MIFQAKIVVANKNPNARIAWAGGGLLFIAMVLMCMDAYRRAGFWLFGVAVVVLLIGAVLTRGNVSAIDVSDIELMVSPEEVSVGDSGNQKQEWQFYLPDAVRVQQLGALFKELYSQRVSFVEREDRMIENGYQ